MKQIIQHLNTGQIEIAEVPSPLVGSGEVLIQSRRSLISAGTERMLVEFSKANLINKVRQQPERVKQVLDKMRTDGVLPTIEAVFRKLDEPMPMGYCNMGTVLRVGQGVRDLKPGDRVISNGPHAEIVCVPKNLCAKVPDEVGDEEAAFTVLGSIALQGVRLARPTLGEKFLVFGMGLLGLITVQLLRANGCEVLAVDVNTQRLRLAESYGAQTVDLSEGADPVSAALSWTGGEGVDGALITASAKNDAIVHQAAQACRKRGRIILIGVVDLNLRRSDFYEKELTFQVSCSYGPGRYDENYEQMGQDYPSAYVRWTEQRNMTAILEAMRSRRLKVSDLVSQKFPLDQAESAYEKVQNDSSVLGLLLEYSPDVNDATRVQVTQAPQTLNGELVAGVIGAGNFATGILIPEIVKTPVQISHIAARKNAHAAKSAAKKFGIESAVTDYRLILDDPRVSLVFIITEHHTHAQMICEALDAGKHVFVEKPLAISEQQLQQVKDAVARNPNLHLMAGFNRRFSSHTQKARELLAGRSEPLCMNMTVNAGALPGDHWIQDPERGGGRIIGECCHFIDLFSYLADSPVEAIRAMQIGPGPEVQSDKATLQLSFSDGSIGVINYFANGAKSYPKEHLEIFSDGRVITVENFRSTRGYGFKNFKKFKTPRQDKGHRQEISAFVASIKNGGGALIPFEQLYNVSKTSFVTLD